MLVLGYALSHTSNVATVVIPSKGSMLADRQLYNIGVNFAGVWNTTFGCSRPMASEGQLKRVYEVDWVPLTRRQEEEHLVSFSFGGSKITTC